MFVFDPEEDTFTKVDIDANFIESRENFSLSILKNSKILLLGGTSSEKIFSDAYILFNYSTDNKINFYWNKLDINGFVYNGYCGQKCINFQNDSVMIFGGIENNWDPLKPKLYNCDPKISNRLQILEINNIITWNLTDRIRYFLKIQNPEEEIGYDPNNVICKELFNGHLKTLVEERAKSSKKKKNSTSNLNNKDKIQNALPDNEKNNNNNKLKEESEKDFLNDKIKLGMHLNRLSHISFILKGEFEKNKNYLILHGGEVYDKILCDLQFYDLDSEKWINAKDFENTFRLENYPQLKNHAWTYFKYPDYILKNLKDKKATNIIKNSLKNHKQQNNDISNMYYTKSLFIDYLQTNNIKNKEFLLESLNEANDKHRENLNTKNNNNNSVYNADISEIIILNSKDNEKEKEKLDRFSIEKNSLFDPLKRKQKVLNFKQDEEDYFDECVVIAGGITVDHKCKNVRQNVIIKSEIKKQINKLEEELNHQSLKISNIEKYLCACEEEEISDKIFLYKNKKFFEISIHKNRLDDSINPELIRRFGHNIVFIPKLNKLFLFCGFSKLKGFIFELIQIQLRDNSKNTQRSFSCDLIKIDNLNNLIPGRIFANCCVYKEFVILFGGVSDKKILDDIWIINFDDKTLIFKHDSNDFNNKDEILFHDLENGQNSLQKPLVSARKVENINFSYNPRYGCASVIYRTNILDVEEKKILIFGGSFFFSEDNKYSGITNEIYMIRVKVRF